MALALFMDVHIQKAITTELRLRSIDVITAQEDNSNRLADPDLLERATVLQRVLVTFDDDLLVEATKRQTQNILFAGVVYGQLRKISIGICVRDLEILAKVEEPEDLANKVVYLPL